jgi:DNA-binding MarR family transcriptional regulator
MQASTPPAAATAHEASAADLAEQLLVLWRRVIATGAFRAYAIFEELDLTLTPVKALCALSGDELTVKELAEHLGLSLPGTSRAVDALVERDLLHRREDARDRRMKRLRTTAAGHATLARLDEARLAGLEAFTATLPHAQRKRLAAALRPIVDDLEEAT